MSNQLGRISGQLLKPNLLRDGVDLTFRNFFGDPDLLKIDVTNRKIKINSAGSSDLDIVGTSRTTNIKSNDFQIYNKISFTNDLITHPNSSINIIPNQSNPLVLMDEAIFADYRVKDNTISNRQTNGNIEIQPSGTGITDILDSTRITGRDETYALRVTGSVDISGNLSKQGNIYIGNDLWTNDGNNDDTVTIVPDFSQSIIPGADNTYNLGRADIRWANVYSRADTDIQTLTQTSMTVSDQLQLDGLTRSIYTTRSNQDVVLKSDTTIIDIEGIRLTELIINNSVAFISGYTLTVVDEPVGGSWIPGMKIQGLGVIDGTVISKFDSGSGGIGTYTININYDGIGGNPAPVGPIAIVGRTDGIINKTADTSLTVESTGIGYVRFMGTNGVVLPAGTVGQRPDNPEVGDTRWNTDFQRIECFDGSVYLIATGPGAAISNIEMEDFQTTYALILG